MEKSRSFIMYYSYYDSIQDLEGTDKLEMYEAINDYAFNDNEPVFSKKILNAVWKNIRPTLDMNIKRYAKNQENGKKGGRPPKSAPISIEKPKEVSQPQKENLTEEMDEIEISFKSPVDLVFDEYQNKPIKEYKVETTFQQYKAVMPEATIEEYNNYIKSKI